MKREMIDNNSFIELLLAVIKLDYKSEIIYYGDLGEFILLCKKYRLFLGLLSSFTFQKIDDAQYYLEIFLPLQTAFDKKIISSIDREYLFLAKNFSVLEILNKNIKQIKEMQNFLKEYFLYIQDVEEYQQKLEEYEDSKSKQTNLEISLFRIKNGWQNHFYLKR